MHCWPSLIKWQPCNGGTSCLTLTWCADQQQVGHQSPTVAACIILQAVLVGGTRTHIFTRFICGDQQQVRFSAGA
jgi:hypothetical protein